MVYNGPVNRPGCCPLVTTSTSPACNRARPASGVVTIRGITSAPPSSQRSCAEHIRQEREQLGSRLPPCVRPEAGFATGGREELFGAPAVFGRHLGEQ